MPLSPGTRFGPYEVAARIGAGGMGEVYRAADTTLGRQVAIKVLPDEFAHDAERLARFEREAKTLAALNHPNIAQIYGLEKAGGARALVMELVEGPTLEDRIAQGPIPLDEALSVARQIADALETAHEQGIVHRDLKPANIKTKPDGTVKVLDFGLAKATEPLTGTFDPTQSPTMIGGPMTEVGVILGTVAYMSPEQARGKAVDKRADIWAFGCVLYEMLTGRRLFDGDTTSDTLSSVLTKEPDLSLAPERVRPLLRGCLERDPRRRLRDIGDAWRLLEQPRTASSSGNVVKWVAALLLAVVTAVALMAWSLTGRPVGPTAEPPIRLALDLGRDASVATDFPIAILSPDGMRIVFVSTGGDGISRLATRLLDRSEAAQLPGTEGAYSPFFSPDGQWVGFFAGGKLKKTRLDGGIPVALCDAPAGRGASWGEDGRIIAALDNRSGLSLVTADGGVVTRATELGPGELTHRVPQMLPGGKAVLFLVSFAPGSYGAASVAVASLGASPAPARVVLPNVGMSPRYLSTGHLVYVANGTLYAVSFDVDRLEVRGSATPVLEDVSSSVGFGFAQLDFSKDGAALYRSGRTTGQTIVQWLDADGKTQPLWEEPAVYQFPQVSPDGSKLVSVVADGANSDIWVYEMQRGTKTRLSGGTGVNNYPIWSADGQYVVFQLAGQLYWTRADAAERPQPLIKSDRPSFPASFTPDGRVLMFYELPPGGGSLIQTVSIESESGRLKAGEPERFRELSAGVPAPTISPDGRWVAYASIESGVYEVYVRAFPDNGRQWPISTGGGSFPVWSRAANELFYRTEDQFLMVTSYSVAGDSFVAAKPRVWSGKRLFNTGLVQNFALAPDGKRFAALMSAEARAGESDRQVMLVLNFFDEVRRRVDGEGR